MTSHPGSLLYKTIGFHVAVCLPCNKSQKTSENSVKNVVPRSAALREPLFCPDCILTSPVIENGTDVRQHPNSTSVRDTLLVLV